MMSMQSNISRFVYSIEKDTQEASTQKSINRDQQDCHQKIQSLKEKFEKCREQIMKVHGISLTRDEQLKRLEGLNKQLIMKKELLNRYKHACPIDISPKI